MRRDCDAGVLFFVKQSEDCQRRGDKSSQKDGMARREKRDKMSRVQNYSGPIKHIRSWRSSAIILRTYNIFFKSKISQGIDGRNYDQGRGGADGS